MKKSFLLVDTNVISHALTPNKTPKYAELFKELEKKYLFAVTGYTQYELMCSSDQSHRAKIEKYIRDDMAYATLNQMLMTFSARLCYLYSKHPSIKNQKISDGDTINAAFSIAKDCPLITIDNNDYPRPFFIEIDRYRVLYESKKNKETMDTLYVLKPDFENIEQAFFKYKA